MAFLVLLKIDFSHAGTWQPSSHHEDANVGVAQEGEDYICGDDILRQHYKHRSQ